jgi:hypothetical protein
VSDDALSDDANELAAQRHEGLVDDARWQALLARHGVPLERAAAEHAAIAEALGELPRPATRPGAAAAIMEALPRATSAHARRRSLWWAPLLAAAACLAVAGTLLMVEGEPERMAPANDLADQSTSAKAGAPAPPRSIPAAQPATAEPQLQVATLGEDARQKDASLHGGAGQDRESTRRRNDRLLDQAQHQQDVAAAERSRQLAPDALDLRDLKAEDARKAEIDGAALPRGSSTPSANDTEGTAVAMIEATQRAPEATGAISERRTLVPAAAPTPTPTLAPANREHQMVARAPGAASSLAQDEQVASGAPPAGIGAADAQSDTDGRDDAVSGGPRAGHAVPAGQVPAEQGAAQGVRSLQPAADDRLQPEAAQANSAGAHVGQQDAQLSAPASHADQQDPLSLSCAGEDARQLRLQLQWRASPSMTLRQGALLLQGRDATGAAVWTLATHLPPFDIPPAAADARAPLYAWPFALSGMNAPPASVTSLTLLAPGYRSAPLALQRPQALYGGAPGGAAAATAPAAATPAKPASPPAAPIGPAPLESAPAGR